MGRTADLEAFRPLVGSIAILANYDLAVLRKLANSSRLVSVRTTLPLLLEVVEAKVGLLALTPEVTSERLELVTTGLREVGDLVLWTSTVARSRSGSASALTRRSGITSMAFLYI